MRLSFTACLLLPFLAAPLWAADGDDAQVHRWVDVYGNVHYDDRVEEEAPAPVTFITGKERAPRVFRTDPFLDGDVFPENEEPDESLRQIYTLPWGWKVTKKTDRLIEYGRSSHPGRVTEAFLGDLPDGRRMESMAGAIARDYSCPDGGVRSLLLSDHSLAFSFSGCLPYGGLLGYYYMAAAEVEGSWHLFWTACPAGESCDPERKLISLMLQKPRQPF